MTEVNLHYDGGSITASLNDSDSMITNVVTNTMVTVLGHQDISIITTLDDGWQEDDRQSSSGE